MKDKESKLIYFKKNILPYLIIIIVVVIIRTFFFSPIRVNGTSMDNTLEDGDIMILNKISLKNGIDRFDIVVVKPDDSDKINAKYIIKRVIGLPGESVAYIDGHLYINEKKVEDKYALSRMNDFTPITLSDDEYFVLGDNRAVSNDSRNIGPVKKDTIKGKANLIIFPFSKIGVAS